ncbi:MAG: cytochrome c3 family protein [Planctomycetota bacterium]
MRLAPIALAALATFAAHARTQDTAPLDRAGTRVAVAECARCHDKEHARLVRGTHAGVLQVAALPGCETCHGPGGAHAAASDNDPALITMPAQLPGDQQIQPCGRCHREQIRRHGGDPDGFRAAGRVCTDCHSVHGRAHDAVAPDVRLRSFADAAAHAERAGSAACIECHPLRERSLHGGPHTALAAATAADGCEKCHGNGSLHVEQGNGRLVTRPDRATDGVATCRQCHAAVDPVEFHWRGKTKPYFSSGLTCTSCHTVHAADTGSADAHATNARCATCHAAALATMPGSTHQHLGQLAGVGCDRCHPGADAHARHGGRKEDLVVWRPDARMQAEVCLACHGSDRSLVGTWHGDHLEAGVGCLDCHGPMHGARRGEVATTAEARCAGCHGAVAAEFALPNHHPVPEGRMRCTSCHDVHGKMQPAQDRELTEARCTRCHTEYRGPFVFAHQAGRRDGCVACHLPHGGTNRRLLQQATTQQNCLQCHGDFPAFHDQTTGAVFTNCIRCHTEVHGSNHARYLLR